MIGAKPFKSGGLSSLQFLMVLQLKEKSRYGYEILKELREHFGNVWVPKTGTIYPALKSLKARGLVKTDLKDDKSFYSLTESGETFLEGIGEHLEDEVRFMNKWFELVNRWMPQSMRKKIAETMRNWAEKDALSPYLVELFTEAGMNKDTQLEILESVRKALERRLNFVEGMIEGIRRDKQK